jgi:hypothetical protein
MSGSHGDTPNEWVTRSAPAALSENMFTTLNGAYPTTGRCPLISVRANMCTEGAGTAPPRLGRPLDVRIEERGRPAMPRLLEFDPVTGQVGRPLSGPPRFNEVYDPSSPLDMESHEETQGMLSDWLYPETNIVDRALDRIIADELDDIYCRDASILKTNDYQEMVNMFYWGRDQEPELRAQVFVELLEKLFPDRRVGVDDHSASELDEADVAPASPTRTEEALLGDNYEPASPVSQSDLQNAFSPSRSSLFGSPGHLRLARGETFVDTSEDTRNASQCEPGPALAHPDGICETSDSSTHECNVATSGAVFGNHGINCSGGVASSITAATAKGPVTAGMECSRGKCIATPTEKWKSNNENPADDCIRGATTLPLSATIANDQCSTGHTSSLRSDMWTASQEHTVPPTETTRLFNGESTVSFRTDLEHGAGGRQFTSNGRLIVVMCSLGFGIVGCFVLVSQVSALSLIS